MLARKRDRLASMQDALRALHLSPMELPPAELERLNQGLAPAPHPVGRGVAPQIGQEFGACLGITRQAARRDPAAEDTARIVLEIFGQIAHRCGDVVVDGLQILLRTLGGLLTHRTPE